MKFITPLIVSTCASFLMLTSCGGDSTVEVVDLDKVLDNFVSTAEAMPAPEEGEEAESTMGTPEKIKEFTAAYAKSLNDNKVMTKPIGVVMRVDGAFLGFEDANSNTLKEAEEKEIFTVEVDSANNRLIATDLANSYHRDQGYRMSGGGFLTGMLVGNMLSGQRRAGVSSGRFSSMKMSPKGYHSSAVKTVRSRSSARSSSGSRSFRSGK